ncbi:hypothetical protein [Sulfolobus acidocaldarius]|uniref:Uncharacterized protein n=2 Tax=Sulfolobus acidocaldarius TaxID=2285 RepID=M1IBX2_9CREN|nr:hypothetical protein [Sulfolobus acidocaldarius]AGE70942.1 hypothetical protein SacN8_04855 [Sulfolobus acidocaldarius N8]AGE73213.1 hypothetical protein SacRon12I_04845 [Sulfolobus acidocaldarius Ron12/I]
MTELAVRVNRDRLTTTINISGVRTHFTIITLIEKLRILNEASQFIGAFFG